MVLVCARAHEERRFGGRDVLARHLREKALDLHLALVARQVHRPVQSRLLRHILEQGVDRIHADLLEHLGPVGVGQREIAHGRSTFLQ